MTTLKQLRKGRGISQGALALLLQEKRGGKAWQGPVSVIEAGKVSPTVKRLTDILGALGYDLELFAKPGNGPPIPLDLDSLLGNGLRKDTAPELPRAKDTRVKDTPEDSLGPFSSPAETLSEAAPDQDHNSLNELLKTILNK